MTKFGTAAAVMGVIAGLWNLWAHFQVCSGPLALCPAVEAAPNGTDGTIMLVLAVILFLVSLGTFVGPPALFYGSVALGLIIDAIELLNYSSISPVDVYITLLLVTVSLGLGLVAARSRTSVSEQSHPMNLPVFG